MDITVGIFLLTLSNKLLICHPTNARWNQWSVPKGLRDDGEDLFDAGIRELYEETNISYDKDIKKNLKFSFRNRDGFKYAKRNKKLFPYFIRLNINDVSIFDLKCTSMVEIEGREPFPEVDKYEWVDLDEAKKLVHDTQVKAIDEYLRELKVINFLQQANKL